MAYDEYPAERVRHTFRKFDADLEYFIRLAPEFNPQAKSGKKQNL